MRRRRGRGFTLLELAIVMLALSFLIGSLMEPLALQMNRSRTAQTQQILEHAYAALLGFAVVNRRLPCPDTSGDGLEDTPCSAREGRLPGVTLGVAGNDAWGRPLRYRADDAYTVSIANPPTPTTNFEIKDVDGNNVSVLDPSNKSRVAAVLFSCGPNGVADLENKTPTAPATTSPVADACANPSVPQNRIYYYNPRSPTFDDILLWLPRNVLFRQLVTAQTWP